LFRLAALADFCNLLAVFVEIRLPLHKAVRLAGKASGDQWVGEASDRMAAEIESGQFESTSAIEVGMPVSICQMLHEATSAEALGEALHGLAEVYGAGAELNSRAVGVVAEPFILLGTSVCLGTVVVALFLPLIKLLNDLS
jgi:type II secretory pathway component PulF